MRNHRMRKFPKWLILFLIVFLIFVLVLVVLSVKIVGRPLRPRLQNLSKLYATWVTYKNTTSKYTIQIPNTWDISEKKKIPNVDSLAVFTPKKNTKYPSTLVITSITATSHPKPHQPLTTQAEFDAWYKKDPKKYDTSSRLNKLNNFTANGQKGIIFIDSGNNGELKANEWSLVTWIRHNNTNFYIYAKGASKITPGDIAGYTHMLSTFRFY